MLELSQFTGNFRNPYIFISCLGTNYNLYDKYSVWKYMWLTNKVPLK